MKCFSIPFFGTSAAHCADLRYFFDCAHSAVVAGVPIIRAVEKCLQKSCVSCLGKQFAVVHERLQHGAQLSEAMADPRCAKVFPEFVRQMIHTGEVNGQLGTTFDRLSQRFRIEKAIRSLPWYLVVGDAFIYLALLSVLLAAFVSLCSARMLRFTYSLLLLISGGVWIWDLNKYVGPRIAIRRCMAVDAHRRDNRLTLKIDRAWFLAVVVALTIILLPFAIEQLGEATGLYKFPAVKMLKGIFNPKNGS